MDCPRCRHGNASGAKFCSECGAALELPCPICACVNPSHSNFCSGCGATLAIASPFAASAPSAYTPPHLAERILTSKAALEGERKHVTILFADVKSSMEIVARDDDPERARAVLDEVLRLMMDAVHRFEGTVNQVMGDGIMALFGAPLAHEDHAQRACYAALRLQETIRQFGSDLEAQGGKPVAVRVGINSGEVVVRAIRNDLHMDYSAIGLSTHLAARMEQLAPPGTILIAPATLSAIEGFFEVRPFGALPVKGLEQPVPLHELLKTTSLRSRLHAVATVRGLTPFVGRSSELASLRRAFLRATHGHGQIIALVGEPGVGKSRLLYEFTRTLAAQPCLLFEGRAVSYARQTAYFSLVEALKLYASVGIRDTVHDVRSRVAEKIRALDPALDDVIPAIQWLLDAEVEGSAWKTMDAALRRQRVVDAMKRLLIREAEARPVVLVFEDLQWVDAETQTVLNGIIEILPIARMMLVATYRPEYEHRWSSRSYYAQVRVDPFSADDAQTFIEAVLGTHESLADLKRALLARTEGNPFFLEETAQTLRERHALTGERSDYRLNARLESIQLPASVQAVLASRIDRLLPEDKRLLEAAAVIGKDVPLPVLQLVSGVPAAALHPRLSRLQAAEFLYETRVSPEVEFTFKHSLTHEVAYGTLLHGHKRDLHAAAVDAIERTYPDRLTEHVEDLARHAVAGEVWGKAVVYCRQDANAAAARSAYREAADRYAAALAALNHEPAGREAMTLGIDIRFEMGTALRVLVDHAPLFDLLVEAERLAAALGDERRTAWVQAYLSMEHWWKADHLLALESGRRALEWSQQHGDRGLEAVAQMTVGWAHHALGQFRVGSRVLQEALDKMQQDRIRFAINRGSPLIAVLSLSWLTTCLAELGEFEEGRRRADEAVRLAEEANHPWSRVAAYYGMGVLHTRRCAFEEALAPLEQAFQLCRTYDIPGWGTTLAWWLGYVRALSGDAVGGAALLEQAVQQAALAHASVHQSLRVGWLAEAELLAGRLPRAVALAEEALERSRVNRERGAEAHVRRILGDIAVAMEPVDREVARRHYGEALSISSELEMRPLEARCCLAIGRLGGDESARGADEWFARARRLFEALGMSDPSNEARPELARDQKPT